MRPSRSPSASAPNFARDNFINVMVRYSCRKCCRAGSERRGVGFAGADAHGVVEAEDENLAVADLAGLGGARDGRDHLVGLVGGDRDLDLDLRQEAHRVFGATIDFRVALLAPVALDLGDSQSLHAERGQGVTDLVELEGFDDGHDDLHGVDPRLKPVDCWFLRSAGRFTGSLPAKRASRDVTAEKESSRVPTGVAARNDLKLRGKLECRFVDRGARCGQRLEKRQGRAALPEIWSDAFGGYRRSATAAPRRAG